MAFIRLKISAVRIFFCLLNINFLSIYLYPILCHVFLTALETCFVVKNSEKYVYVLHTGYYYLYGRRSERQECIVQCSKIHKKVLKLTFWNMSIQIYLNPVCGFKRSGWLIIGFWEAKPGFWKRLEFELFLYRIGPRWIWVRIGLKFDLWSSKLLRPPLFYSPQSFEANLKTALFFFLSFFCKRFF